MQVQKRDGIIIRTHVFAKFLNLKLRSTASPSLTSAQPRPCPSSVSSVEEREDSSEPLEKRGMDAAVVVVVDIVLRYRGADCCWVKFCKGDGNAAVFESRDGAEVRGRRVESAMRRRRVRAGLLISEGVFVAMDLSDVVLVVESQM